MQTEYIYLEAPNYLPHYANKYLERTIFLAGSITGAWNWQKVATDILINKFNIFNPRRENYSTFLSEEERRQIQWEYNHLELAPITLFYFSQETLAPITLLEYGKELVRTKYAPYRQTYVCIDNSYKRKNDVLIQTELENPAILKNVFFDLNEMCYKIIQDNP